DLIVNEIPTLTEAEINAVCDIDNDGLVEFFLPFAEDFIIEDATGFSFTYFESLTDAQNNENAIEDPENYTNIETPLQTLFVVVTNDETGCLNIQPITIEALQIPQIIEPDLLEECDTSEENNGFAEFDLEAEIEGITG
ncbi:hypothetical protein, partial [Psychroflexus maritimus]